MTNYIIILCNTNSKDSRDEYMRNPFGQCRLYLVHQFLVEHVAFGDGKHSLFVQHFGVESAKLVQQDFVFLTDVVTVGRHHEQQQ